MKSCLATAHSKTNPLGRRDREKMIVNFISHYFPFFFLPARFFIVTNVFGLLLVPNHQCNWENGWTNSLGDAIKWISSWKLEQPALFIIEKIMAATGQRKIIRKKNTTKFVIIHRNVNAFTANVCTPSYINAGQYFATRHNCLWLNHSPNRIMSTAYTESALFFYC